jgi:NTP pyrophosphatase (non-canonical NTP hydrolase)
MTEQSSANLGDARDEAIAVRALYEILEQRLNGRTWTLEELMLGFSNDVGTIGRLLLAHSGTWAVDGDATEQLRHKLAESLWWLFVLADKTGVDIDSAFADTMHAIREGLEASIHRLD